MILVIILVSTLIGVACGILVSENQSWNATKKILPNKGQLVIALYDNGYSLDMYFASYEEKDFANDSKICYWRIRDRDEQDLIHLDCVTHWRHIPTPPVSFRQYLKRIKKDAK